MMPSLSRRDFLQSSLGLATFSWLGRSVFSEDADKLPATEETGQEKGTGPFILD